MPVLTGTATDHVDLYDQLRDFLVTAGPTGPGWTELDYDSVANSALFEAPGISGSEEIHLGLGYVEDAGVDSFSLTGWMFRDYNAALPHTNQPGYSGIRYHQVWDDSMLFWFIANGQRVIIVTKVSTVYTASYLGKFLPYGAPGEYPQPYYMGMPYSSNTRWSTVNEGFRNFFDPGLGGLLLTPSISWLSVSNFTESSGESSNSSNGFVFPFHANIGGSTTVTRDRYRQLRDRVDGGYNLRPLVLCCTDPTDDIFGEIDGAYAIPAFSAASEDIIEVGADEYLVLQNCFRTARYYYAAIKLT
jgi:hypothetical protein